MFGLGGLARSASLPRPSGEFVVKMVPGGENLLTSHRGKVVVLALVSTTCPHCQRFIPVLNQAHRDYAAKGVQVIGAAFNPMANMYVPDFIRQFRPEFPFGWSMREPVHEFLQHSPMMQLYVPIVVGIDRQGVVRAQHAGDDPFFENEHGNLRAMIDNLLKLPAGKSAGGAGGRAANAARK